MTTMNKIIVTKHGGLVNWLKRQGVVDDTTPVISRASIKDIKNKVVFGVLPLRVAAYALAVIGVEMPRLPVDLINANADLSADDMDKAGARLVRYVVTAEDYHEDHNEIQHQ